MLSDMHGRLALAALVVEIGCILVAETARSIYDWAWGDA